MVEIFDSVTQNSRGGRTLLLFSTNVFRLSYKRTKYQHYNCDQTLQSVSVTTLSEFMQMLPDFHTHLFLKQVCNQPSLL